MRFQIVLGLPARHHSHDGGQVKIVESEFEKVAETGDLSPGEMKSVVLGQDEVLLANVDGNIYAIGDTCTHAMGSLSRGELHGDQVQCPRHGARFSVVTGEVLGAPADDGVQVYEVRISGQDILLGPAKG